MNAPFSNTPSTSRKARHEEDDMEKRKELGDWRMKILLFVDNIAKDLDSCLTNIIKIQNTYALLIMQ